MTGKFSYWDYRVLHDNGVYYVGEVFYEDGKPSAYSGPISPQGESRKELDDEVSRMYSALEKDVLEAW